MDDWFVLVFPLTAVGFDVNSQDEDSSDQTDETCHYCNNIHRTEMVDLWLTLRFMKSKGWYKLHPFDSPNNDCDQLTNN